MEIDDDMATSDGSATGSEPLWSGEISPDQIPGGAYSCPSFVPLARNMVYVPQYNEEAIWLVPGLEKVSDDGYSVYGDPMASYAVAPVDISSIVPLGKYVMRGGLMKAVCKVKVVRTAIGWKVVYGRMRWYDYTGTVKLASDGSGGGESRGWGWFEDSNGVKTGAGSGTDGTTYSSAIDNYLGGRGCTRGWEIWINQSLRCDVEGHAH